MQSDNYKVKVIHFLNPHLIWVEVLDSPNENKSFEQIGIYGLLPHETTLDLESSKIIDRSCWQWVPAAANLMQEFLKNAQVTWFSPTFIDRRTSVLQDNIHKYGEIIIETASGETENFSEWLSRSGFAELDNHTFHSQLISGHLQIMLNELQLLSIYSHLKAHGFIKPDSSTTNRTRSPCTRSVSDRSSKLSQIRYENVLKNSKFDDNDLEEEVPMGRGCRRKYVNELNELEPYNVIKNYFDKMSSSKSSVSDDSNNDRMNKGFEKAAKVNKEQAPVDNVNKDKGTDKEKTPKALSALHKLELLKNITNKAASIKLASEDTLDGNGNNMGKEPLNKTDGFNNNIEAKETRAEKVISTEKKEEKSVTMTAFQRKLQLLKKFNNVSSSDTSNKGTSDEEADIIEKINEAYPLTNMKKALDNNKEDSNNIELDANLDNIGKFMCNFVDKLVTPVLMVHAKFNKVIKPIYSMPDIPFNENIKIVLRSMSVKGPMDLQSVSWYTILRGHSVFMISPKDSGKTMGYLPCVCRLVADGTPETDSIGPICIIVCATAESVTSVEKLSKMLLGVNDKVLACYAGVDDLYITTSLLNRCDLLICTPSALTRIFQVTNFDVDLRRLRTFVLDDCERLDQVYKHEIKFFHYKIRELEKTRANKEVRVQYIVASRKWCGFMESLAKKAPDTVISIGSFCECVLYSKANMSASFVAKINKVKTVCDFLSETDASKKAVIVCRHNSDVEILENELKFLKRYIFVGHSNLTVSELYNLSAAWRGYNVPMIGPILLCTDDTLSHMNITDAHYLVHYSLPNSFSLFRKRFSVLNDNYPSIFSTERENIKIKILLQNEDTEKLPKILNFIKRCTDDVPPFVDELCNKVLAKRDLSKANKLVPLCEALLSLGYCPDFYDCLNRHKVLKDFDTPSDWLPKNGTVTFKILHYHTATSYSARLLSHIEKKEVKYPQTYNTLSLKLGMYYGKASNRKLHGIPKVGDICAVSVEYNLFARCQVIKILNTYQRGNPNYVLIKLLDEEKYERSRDIYLYHLPKDFRDINTYVIQVRLANVQPKDKDVTFSILARDHIRSLVNADDDVYLRSQIIGVIGNCIFVDTLEACQKLSSLDEIVVKHNLKRELLEKHAEVNPDHISKLKDLCLQNDVTMIFERNFGEQKKDKKEKVTPSWAYLDKDEALGVFVSSVINPCKLFVRLTKFEPCMHVLVTDIKSYLKTKPKRLNSFDIGDIVIAKFPEDDFYERARIDAIENENIKCFFVDMGDWKVIAKKYIYPITDKLITQLPFQAIECRLINIKPPGDDWTDFSINWLINYSDEGTTYFYAKYFIKETAEFTGGHKYAIALYDTNSDSDKVVNQLMVDLNLAKQIDEEFCYLGKVAQTNTKEESEEENKEDEWTKFPESPRNSDVDVEFQKVSLSKVFPSKPIRSVPLVDSVCESETSDKWEIYKPEDFISSLVPQLKGLSKPVSELPALTANGLEVEEVRNSKLETVSDGLDSDDLSDSPASTSHENALSIKPKLVWRQNKSFVTIKIQLIGVDSYKLKIEDRSINFSTYHNDTNYYFEFELYAVVEKTACTHSNKGQYILVKLVKVLHKNWLTLTKDPAIKKWIVYDVDAIEASSDEEILDDSIKKIAKEMHEEQDIDSDDDDFVDDVNYKYK